LRTITSRKSERVKELTKLHKKSSRYAAGHFLAEGPSVVAMAPSDRIEELFLTEEYLEEFESFDTATTLVSAEVMSALCESESPQGVLALCSIAKEDSTEILSRPGQIVIVDSLSDPGNMGTIIRTAHAAGAAGILTFGSCVDPLNSKVVRSSAGSLFLVPIAQVAGPEVLPKDRPVFVLTGQGSVELHPGITAGSNNPIWVIGSEAHGVSDTWVSGKWSFTGVRIPMAAGVESLNAAVSAALCLYSHVI
jgi:TrmH family RNA methyltransferase